MAQDPVFLILKFSAWLPASDTDSVLGAAVKNFLSPTNNSVPDYPLTYSDYGLSENSFTDFVLKKGRSRGRAAEEELKSIASIKLAGKANEDFDLSGKIISYKRIRQHDSFWANIKTNESFKETVLGWIRPFGPPVCMVMGVLICEDVEVSFDSQDTASRIARGEVPLGTIAVAAAGIPNPSTVVSSESKTVTCFRANNAKANIFALELKIITSKLFNRRELRLKDKGPKIEKGRQLGDDDDEEVEVEDLRLEELDLSEWEGDWEKDFGEEEEVEG